MKFPVSIFSLVILTLTASFAQDKEAAPKTTNLPPDPFGDLEPVPVIPDYAMKVDRTRGLMTIDAKDGTYVPGSHFAHWNWTTNAKRWGNYYVTLNYESVATKMGINVKIGENTVKSYAPRTSSGEPKLGDITLGTIYVPKSGEYPVTLLSADKSNGPAFFVRGLTIHPAPEGKVEGQSIDGSIELPAKTATTYSEMMRYEPKPEKNCLGYWIDEKDWAEWVFEAGMPGKFKVSVVQGCGTGNGGSEVAVLVNDQTLKFTVEDTGGFQEWKTLEIGEVEIKHAGEQKLAIMPLKKSAKAVMDIQKIFLEPVAAKTAAAE